MTTRRQFLQGTSIGTGSLLLAPILGQLKAQATGAAKLPPRFVFMVEGNGLAPRQVTPLGFERGNVPSKRASGRGVFQLVNESLVDRELPAALQPIKQYQDRLTVVNGLSGRIAGGGHSNNFGALGVYNCKGGVGNSGAPVDETIDVAIGKQLGGIFPHVGLGMVDRPNANVIYNCSAWGKGQPTPTICQPMTAYSSLFGSVAGGNSKAEFHARTNLLDFLAADVRRLQKEVPAAERDKLEAHLQGYEDMRNRQSRLNDIENTLRKQGPVVSNKYTSEVETDRLDAQFDIGTAALIGGLTRSLTLASGVGDPYFGVKFTGLGINFGKHGIGHGGSYNGMTAEEMTIKIRTFHFELIARMMKKLEAVPEGDGTMLDNTVIVYLSDSAESHHSRCGQWPFVLFPGKNTGLAQGRYIDYPYYGADGHREIGNLYTTLLQVAGQKRDYFGHHDLMLTGKATGDGPLAPMLA